MRRILLSPAVLVVAVLVFAGSAAAATDSYDGVAFYPFTMAADNTDCVAWTDDVAGPTRNCDPINVLFPHQSLDVVTGRLRAAQWIDTGGGTQWLYAAAGPIVSVQAQLATQDPTDPSMRYHVRLWQAGPDLVVGNVHHEHGTPHQIDLAWDSAEAFLAEPLCGSWCRQVYLPTQSSMERGSGVWRGWGNDAWATVVSVPPPPSPPAKPVVKKKHKKHVHVP